MIRVLAARQHLNLVELGRDVPAMPYRLTTFVLAGGYCGIAAISMVYVSTWDRYGFAIATYQQWCLVGMAAGMFTGAVAELAFRIFQRRGYKFSIREFMLVMAIAAAAITVCGALAKHANSPNRGINNAGVPYQKNGSTYHR